MLRDLWRRKGERGLRLVCALATVALGCAGGGGLGSFGGLAGGGTSESTIVAGLKEALAVGTQNAVGITSRPGGYLDNPLIRIGLPGALDKLAKGLRAVGYGGQVDELELAMNRAAEQAAGEATDVFVGAIRQMTFSDALAILDGGDTAATQYFERTTRPELKSRFEPIVSEKMGQVGVVKSYDELLGRYSSIPFTQSPSLDIRSYVTDRALDGLFTVLGEQERKIRTDPAARTTALLKQVFGR